MHDTRKIEVRANIHAENDRIAAEVNHEMTHRGVLVVNEMGAPGVGKTTVLLQLIERLSGFGVAVIEGDIESDLDTQLLRERGVPAFQINTFGACHLDAPMIAKAIFDSEYSETAFDLPGRTMIDAIQSILFIENVGNLVCPAEFSIGEHMKLLICSVTEGSDKPYKYPLAFREAGMIMVNKIDLLPYLDFDEEFFMRGLRALNKEAPVFMVSGKTGEGFDDAAAELERIAAAEK